MRKKSIERSSHKTVQPSIHQTVASKFKHELPDQMKSTGDRFSSKKVNQDNRQSFSSIKKQFTKIVDDLQMQYKKNNLIYRQKYIELVNGIFQMFSEANLCYQAIRLSHTQPNKVKLIEQAIDSQGKIVNEAFKEFESGEPMLLIDYCIKFCQHITTQFNSFENREQKLRKQMMEMFSMSGNHNFLETLARKNLETHELSCKNQQLRCQIQVLVDKLDLSIQNIQNYHKKFTEIKEDYDMVIISMANMLKKCENNQVELKQENRLQGEMLQSHKIEFERYKMNFKQREGLAEKQNKMRRILQKQYEDKGKLLQKQITHEVLKKFGRKG